MYFYYLNLINYFLINFLILFYYNERKLISFAFLTEPKLVYVDGSQPWDNCRPGLKRSLISLTGLLLSHPFYGSLPYNASRNCFLTIAVPVGYRVRLKALDFDVQGQWGKCEREDTLHIFDHNQQLEPETLTANEQLPIGGHSPGRLLGEFCGKIETDLTKTDPSSSLNQRSILAESSQNALTLWWHTEDLQNLNNQKQTTPLSTLTSKSINLRTNSQGFRLLWSSFRYTNSSSEKCRTINSKSSQQNNSSNLLLNEFKCKKTLNSQKIEECIPTQLGCNSYADCLDGSDLDAQLQLKHGCEHIPNIPLSVLISSGPKRLLLCAALLLLWLSLCLGCCCCYISYRRKRLKKKRSSTNSSSNDGDCDFTARKQQLNNERGNLFYSFNGNIQRQNNGDLIPTSQPPPPPLLPPPSFSPPTLKNNKLLQTNFVTQQPFGGFINPSNTSNLQENKKLKRSSKQQTNSCSSNSQSSSQKHQQQLNNPPSISSFENQQNLKQKCQNVSTQQQMYFQHFNDTNKLNGINCDDGNYLYLKEPMTPLITRGKQQTMEGQNRHLII
uniref:CUB domain-containing protein n=1 Tax=Meloidogyne enterolobii TaxID=390850 RepID=A0A6V7WYA0_MELEN|nr:unnamed protein product [Meloidogyne enterolobii]